MRQRGAAALPRTCAASEELAGLYSAWAGGMQSAITTTETPLGKLSRGIKAGSGRYAQWFNWRHVRRGHFWEVSVPIGPPS